MRRGGAKSGESNFGSLPRMHKHAPCWEKRRTGRALDASATHLSPCPWRDVCAATQKRAQKAGTGSVEGTSCSFVRSLTFMPSRDAHTHTPAHSRRRTPADRGAPLAPCLSYL